MNIKKKPVRITSIVNLFIYRGMMNGSVLKLSKEFCRKKPAKIAQLLKTVIDQLTYESFSPLACFL